MSNTNIFEIILNELQLYRRGIGEGRENGSMITLNAIDILESYVIGYEATRNNASTEELKRYVQESKNEVDIALSLMPEKIVSLVLDMHSFNVRKSVQSIKKRKVIRDTIIKVKDFLDDYSSEIIGTIVTILVIGIVISFFHWFFSSIDKEGEERRNYTISTINALPYQEEDSQVKIIKNKNSDRTYYYELNFTMNGSKIVGDVEKSDVFVKVEQGLKTPRVAFRYLPLDKDGNEGYEAKKGFYYLTILVPPNTVIPQEETEATLKNTLDVYNL